MFFFFKIIAIIKDIINEITINNGNAYSNLAIDPRGTFIPINEDIIVGIDNTIVAPAKNFIT